MVTSARRTTVGRRRPARHVQDAEGAARAARCAAPVAASSPAWPDLPHEEVREEPYRPELVARLERAVREGTYRPDARAIAEAIVSRIDSLQ